jgi:hypothetical protein
MDQVRHVLEMLLNARQPFPAYVVDRAWNLVMTNPPAQTLTGMLFSAATAALFSGNVLRLFMHPEGMRTHVVNWESAATSLLHRFERELALRPGDPVLHEVLENAREYPGTGHLGRRPEVPSGSDLLIPLHIRTPVGELRLLTTIATIGAPYDVTLEELRLETLLPADPETESILRDLSS